MLRSLPTKRTLFFSKSAAFTADPRNAVYLCNPTSASFTATLPAVAQSQGVTLSFKIEANLSIGSNTVTIDGNASETIDNALTLVLYMAGDAVSLYCDGSKWVVVASSIQKHKAQMVRAASQGIPVTMETLVLLDSETYDNGGIADPTTGKFTVRRAGRHRLGAAWHCSQVVNGNMSTRLYHNTTRVADTNIYGINSTPTATIDVVAVAGDTFELRIYQEGTNPTLNTSTGVSLRPRMQVQEL